MIQDPPGASEASAVGTTPRVANDGDTERDIAEIRDITVLGAGPVGLAAAFWAGMREASVRVVDSLPDLGGQLTALYPEKWVFDVVGHPRVVAKDLVRLLREQSIGQFDVPVHLETTARTIAWEPAPAERDGQLLVINTDRGELRSRTLIVAGGHGAFEPKKLPGYDMTPWEGRGAQYLVGDKRELAGRRVVIVGGGDSACDWALNLLDVAHHITLVHRRVGFRAHEATVAAVLRASEERRLDVRTPYQIKQVRGSGTVEQVTLFHSEDEAMTEDVPCDAILLQLGFKTALGPLASWGFDVAKGAIVVDPVMKTNLPRVWACGDITTFDGKLKLIATGFAEAAIAVAQAVHAIRPETKIQPKYSTNTGVPGVVTGQP
jgi:thioredoxin reductase (NADPH)